VICCPEGPQCLGSNSFAAIFGAGFVPASLYGAETVDPSADAAQGKEIVQARCVKCPSGEWQDETYESVVALVQGVSKGTVKHRIKITPLSDTEVKQVAAYWTPKPKTR
jgi:hypothetical protein